MFNMLCVASEIQRGSPDTDSSIEVDGEGTVTKSG